MFGVGKLPNVLGLLAKWNKINAVDIFSTFLQQTILLSYTLLQVGVVIQLTWIRWAHSTAAIWEVTSNICHRLLR